MILEVMYHIFTYSYFPFGDKSAFNDDHIDVGLACKGGGS